MMYTLQRNLDYDFAPWMSYVEMVKRSVKLIKIKGTVDDDLVLCQPAQFLKILPSKIDHHVYKIIATIVCPIELRA